MMYSFGAARLPRWIVRGRTQAMTAALTRSGSSVVPSSATLTLTREGGEVILDQVAATIAGADATVSLAGSSTSALALGEGWQERWDFTVNGEVVTVVRDAALCRSAPTCTVTDDDVIGEHTVLRDVLTRGRRVTWQDHIDRAWEQVQRHLLQLGRYPYLMLSPWSLHDVVVFQARGNIFRAEAAVLGSGYDRIVGEYLNSSGEANNWGQVRLTYDSDADGVASSGEAGQATVPVYYLGGAPAGGRWLR